MASPYPDYGPHRRRHSFEGGNESETQLHPYPPTTPFDRPDSSSTLTIAPKSDPNVAEDRINRTPSPTPSEARELKTGAIDWKSLLKWRFWIRKEWAWYYVIIIVIVTITALVSIFHKEIVQWLKPAATWLHNLPFGWLVPIGILFVISFPPLFGHEIVAILCGLVWGLWIGFGIVAAGTFLGEVGNFYAFKYCCRSRGEKLERTKLSYACLAKVVRDGGFRIALAARLSAIPGHFTTAVFSTCGMGIFVFSLAAILSLPKQFVTVYLGVILEQSESGESTTTSKLISNIVLGVTILITIAAMWYILHQMNKVKPEIIYAKRKARQAKLARAGLHPTSSDTTLSGSTVDVDLTDSGMIPLKPKSNVYAPQPQRPSAYTNPYDMQDDSPDSDPDAYNYTQMRQGGRRSRSRGRGGDMLSIVREDSDEVGWDMAPAGMPLPTADPSYSPIPPAHGIANANMPTRQPIAGRTSSDNPYITSRGTLSPRQTQTHSLPPHNEIRPPSQASHIITFDPDTVTVSSAPNTPDLTLPTPPYTQDAFAANTTQYQPRTNVNTSSYPPQLTSTYPLQQQQQHRRVNPELSPFRDPIPIPVHLSSQQFSLTHASQSTPNLVPMTAEVHRSFTEYAAQRQQQEQQMQSHSLHTSPEIVGRPPPFASNGNVPTRSDSWGTNSNIGPAIPPPQYEQAVFGGPGSVNSNAPMRDRHGGHDGEPSDATYHTAWGSGHSTDRSDFR